MNNPEKVPVWPAAAVPTKLENNSKLEALRPLLRVIAGEEIYNSVFPSDELPKSSEKPINPVKK